MTPILSAVVWTYWFAPVLFAAAVVLDLGIAVIYVKRFVLPRLVVKVGPDERAVEHPVEMRPRRSTDEQTASAA
jgi:hypothetical protein